MDWAGTLKLDVPVIQAPMAGVSTPAMAAAVSEAGGLGSLGLGASTPSDAARMMQAVRDLTDRPYHVNLFVHQEPQARPDVEAAWLNTLASRFEQFGARPPKALRTIYDSFIGNDAMLAVVLEAAPTVVSFHFGLPDAAQVAALKAKGCLLMASATCLAEATAARDAGMDAVVAQGYEAGGHRGMFNPDAPDERLGMADLTRLLVKQAGLPVIAAGAIMDGRDVRAVLNMGAMAAQMGTAFVGCDESAADAAYRAALFSDAASHTVMTRVISGRPARCLSNGFTALDQGRDALVPDYPRAYDAGKALNQAAKSAGDGTYGAQWAGQGAPRARAISAAQLMAALKAELAFYSQGD